MAEPRRAARDDDPLPGARLLVVEARFYDAIGAMLLDGATAAIEAAGASATIVSVPGALEIPAAMAISLDAAANIARPFDGAVALGCIIRGETYHFEIVANESARALMELSVQRKFPIGNGILTVENEAQALVRADPKQLDKGGDAARAALALIRLRRNAGAAR
ncbi:MAG: 6,7-dimethyl-8-ribityllumazine synthase [Methylobacteriaceae bacterium]|nr:6,7-dimethyl-8-ribityllumazine synthase [Methylobacteriaceae bacterium]